jgi:hypothetical protein
MWSKLKGLNFSHSKTTAIQFHMNYSHPSGGFQEKARKLHRLALLPISPVRSRCLIVGLEIMDGLLPLELFLQKTLIQTYL